MARTDLSLGNLYRAVSGSARPGAVSMGALSGNSNNSSFIGFATDGVTVTPPTFTYIVESTTENAQFSFNSTGSLFYSKVQITILVLLIIQILQLVQKHLEQALRFSQSLLPQLTHQTILRLLQF
jgi:hypothetical protein